MCRRVMRENDAGWWGEEDPGSFAVVGEGGSGRAGAVCLLSAPITSYRRHISIRQELLMRYLTYPQHFAGHWPVSIRKPRG